MPVFDLPSGDQLIVQDNVVLLEEFQDCLIGIGEHKNPKGTDYIAVYDKQKCVKQIADQMRALCDIPDCEEICEHVIEAEDTFSYNTLNVYYNPEGNCMPVFVDVLEDM